jgi:hypothetical protein
MTDHGAADEAAALAERVAAALRDLGSTVGVANQ